MQRRRERDLPAEELIDQRVLDEGLRQAVRAHPLPPVGIVDHVECALVRQKDDPNSEPEEEERRESDSASPLRVAIRLRPQDAHRD